MTSGRILPIPLWMILLLFLVGTGMGLGAGYFILQDEKIDISKLFPWSKSENTDNTIEKTGTQTTAGEVQSPKALKYPKTDERWLNNITNGPVKRALSKTALNLTNQINEILFEKNSKPSKMPEIIPVYFKFKTIGSMAKMVELETFCLQDDCNEIENILKEQLIEKRYDFPVEDGNYELLYNFTFEKTEQKPLKEQTTPQN